MKNLTGRNLIFISKATPGDDQFVLWLAPRLEAAGFKVFADIFDLDAGDEWHRKIVTTLREQAIKMLLCCSDETLAKSGVREEIAIAKKITKQIQDSNFIIPLKIRTFKKCLGINDLQYVDFEDGWAKGLERLLNSLEKQQVPKVSGGVVQSGWSAYLRRRAVEVKHNSEVLTSNWLRITRMPDKLNYLIPHNRSSESLLRTLGKSFKFPAVEFGDGFLTFANPLDLEEHFNWMGQFRIKCSFDILDFLENGSLEANIEIRDAASKMVDILRQAWEKHCIEKEFFTHEFSSGQSFHVGESKLGLKRRVSWGRQGERRSSMLRGVARKKIWEYGVSVTPSLFPCPHMRLKTRVLFSDIDKQNKPVVISDTERQFRLRRSICSVWRNKAWHGRLMAFMKLLAGDNPYVDLAVGSNVSIILDAMPMQFTVPVTARQTNLLGEDAKESDVTTLGNHYEDEDT